MPFVIVNCDAHFHFFMVDVAFGSRIVVNISRKIIDDIPVQLLRDAGAIVRFYGKHYHNHIITPVCMTLLQFLSYDVIHKEKIMTSFCFTAESRRSADQTAAAVRLRQICTQSFTTAPVHKDFPCVGCKTQVEFLLHKERNSKSVRMSDHLVHLVMPVAIAHPALYRYHKSYSTLHTRCKARI